MLPFLPIIPKHPEGGSVKGHTFQTTEQTQRLTLTPSMQMALQVLQMSNLDLQAFLDQQLQENPMLELEEQSNDSMELEADRMRPERSDVAEGVFRGLDDNLVEAVTAPEPRRLDPHDEDAEDAKRLIESHPASPPTLQDVLRLQLGCVTLKANDRDLAARLLDELDEYGLLSTPLDDLAQQLQVPVADLERLLAVLQTFDPPGVGARSLQECLLIQLRHRGCAESLAAQIVQHHFQTFLQGNRKRLATQCQRPVAEVDEACQLIRQLRARPYQPGSTEPDHPLIPDLTIRRIENRYEVELCDEQLPGLTLSASYRRLLRNPSSSEEVRGFLKERLRQAVWLLRAVKQRHETLLAIAHCLIAVQREFLEHGLQALKPLTHTQVAQAIGRHPSTISRAISGKCLDTPYGILPLERFFASRVPQRHQQESLSDATIKAHIETLVQQEDARRPLSDEAIVVQLRKGGVSVARRTVAKYRGTLHIFPAYLRRRAHHPGGNHSAGHRARTPQAR